MKENYHDKTISNIAKIFQTSDGGLGWHEAKRRLAKYGPNTLPETKADSIFVIFLRQFRSPLIAVLVVANIIVFLIGDKTDGVVILFVLLFNSVVGTVQEGRARNIFEALKNLAATNASVLRDGKEYVVSDEDIVPGDVIVLREGERISADARLTYSESLQTNESVLTGESKSKFKDESALVIANTSLAERKNMVFKGTSVVSGYGRAFVVGTGVRTVVGGIAKTITALDTELPLQKSIARLSRFILMAVCVMSAVLFAGSLLRGGSVQEAFVTVVAVAVSLIPEGLPIVVTMVLAMGVWRMGKRGVLVKKLQAVEALGQTDVLAVDKTGTLTRNELRVKTVFVGGKTFSVNGVGYDSTGSIEQAGAPARVSDHPDLQLIARASMLCSSAHIAYDAALKVWKISGDPTEAATSVFSEKAGFQRADLEKEYVKIAEKPFDYKEKYHATLHKKNDENFFRFTAIGAPEKILNVSGSFLKSDGSREQITNAVKTALIETYTKMSEKGLRVVAVSIKQQDSPKIPDTLQELDFIGFLGIEDSLRSEVKEAVSRVRSANIDLVMITGDHRATAQTIAQEAGIWRNGDAILEGLEVDDLSEKELSHRLNGVSVFARVNPFHKLKIVNAYKLSGKTVAMTGDGVNDALSLTAADVGVSMGKTGTEVAKEASDIVVLDDNFGSIVSGVEEGRHMFQTIKRVILYLFSTSLGEALTILGSLFLGFPLPLLAAQILWLNLVTDGFLDVALAMEPSEKTRRRFGRSESKLVDGSTVARMFFMAIPMAIGTLYLFGRNYETDIQKAWTLSLTTMAVFQWLNAWNCRSRTKSVFSLSPFANKFLIGATGFVVWLQVMAIYHPFFQSFLKTVPLDARDWAIILLIACSVIAVEELRKALARKFEKNH